MNLCVCLFVCAWLCVSATRLPDIALASDEFAFIQCSGRHHMSYYSRSRLSQLCLGFSLSVDVQLRVLRLDNGAVVENKWTLETACWDS